MVKVSTMLKYLEELEAHLIPTEELKECARQIYGDPIPGPWVNIENDCTNEQNASNLEGSEDVELSISQSIDDLLRVEEEVNDRQLIPVMSIKKDTKQKEGVLSEDAGICDSRTKRIVDPTLGPRVYLSDQSSDLLAVSADSKQKQIVINHPVVIPGKRKVLFKSEKRIKRSRLSAYVHSKCT